MSADIQEMIELVFGPTALIAAAVTIAGLVAFVLLSAVDELVNRE